MKDSVEIQNLSKKLDTLTLLLKYILVLNLYNAGVSQQIIAAQLGMSKTTVNGMLKGVARETPKNEKTKS